MKRCWTGHYFASNVGILPTTSEGVVNPQLIFAIPLKKFGKPCRRRTYKRLRRALMRPCCAC